MPAIALNPLHRRIIAALQVDGRAPWRRVAEALGEPERTVARYGGELLESGRVVIAAVQHSENQVILASRSVAGTARLNAEALAQRNDVVFCYLTAGTADVVAEIGYRHDLSELLTLQLPSIAGLQKFTAMPVLKYFKTIRGWRTGALTADEERSLAARGGQDRTEWTIPATRGAQDHEIISALKENGRVSVEALARRVRMSEAAVARRVEWLLGSGQVSIRALVDPALVGFGAEALLWIQAPPSRVEMLGQHLRHWPEVRYAAAVAGESQLLVNVTVATHGELYALLSHPLLAEHTAHIRTDLVVEARKRGGRVLEHRAS